MDTYCSLASLLLDTKRVSNMSSNAAKFGDETHSTYKATTLWQRWQRVVPRFHPNPSGAVEGIVDLHNNGDHGRRTYGAGRAACCVWSRALTPGRRQGVAFHYLGIYMTNIYVGSKLSMVIHQQHISGYVRPERISQRTFRAAAWISWTTGIAGPAMVWSLHTGSQRWLSGKIGPKIYET